MVILMTNCKINKHVQEWIDIVENGTYETCEDQKRLVKYVKHCFETEDIYMDDEQFEKYIRLIKYFPYDILMPWQKFVIGLHDCTYWRETGMPRWPDLFCLIGRGAGKDGTIAWESVCLVSPYNHGIREYDVDICANNEEQAMRPVYDIINAFDEPKHMKKLKRFFYWTKEQVRSLRTKAIIKGRTNSPKGKDGLRSGICIFNEVHQYQDYKNINVFTTGLGKKKHPRRSYYTTNGDVREGVLDDLIDKSEEILQGNEPDYGLLPFICRLDSKEEVHDEKNWPKANPSLPYFPNLLEEIRKEYRDWKQNPQRLSAFMVKRMNIPDGSSEIKVTDWENIAVTKTEIVDVTQWPCTCGVDFSKITDWASVNLHFRDGDQRYDINHSWICSQSKDIPRLKIPWRDWAEDGRITIVDEPEIHPQIITDYIQKMKQYYRIKMLAIDDFRYALLSKYLETIGFDKKIYKNLKLIRPSDIMRVVPVIDHCFVNHWFHWGEAPELRWATNNTKLVRHNRKIGQPDDMDFGNYVYGKIEAKSRKTDPFMALVASMVVEDVLPEKAITTTPKIKIYSY